MELDVYKRYPLEIVDAHGMLLKTKSGQELIDFYGGHAAAILGYRHPQLLEALAAQAESVFFQTNAVHLPVRDRAARKLAALAPGALNQVFFVNSGAEANENALRIALKQTGRDKVIALSGGFHGRSAAAAAVTDGHAAWYGFPQKPFEVEFIDPEDLDALAKAITDQVAAIILEPVQGMAGARALSDEYLQAVRQHCSELGALLIADEVQCGCGRTGSAFAMGGAAVEPDLLTTAKGIAGGFPAAALIMTDSIAEKINKGDLGTTFGGGPLACAMIEVICDHLASPMFLSHVCQMEQIIRQQCEVGPVKSISGKGLLLGLHCDRPAAAVLPVLLEQGILAGGSSAANIVRLMPPLTVGESEIAALAAALKEIA